MSVRITVLLDEDLDARFTAHCHERGFKKSTLVARLVRDYLAKEAIPQLSDQQSNLRRKPRARDKK
ncbi:hypothetical protein [Mesorhizobium atlanticum]|uniref:Uncharacterized protein n=1 Tax=Mesorhizobium atlanticum TaxID=2233532 RepID=A0A330GZ95_9HYPH|nr:hypothetical protein [Mesorhizobium atlanticum]RAZ78246.1 hypothetical protein DPM35_06580 [Mesorhizobium atlanticum]